ncbi:unnamed protein product [Haemonchus placei]|uniref:Secreted protein n=1 Tax=Haemonchus placei TaxID=6290 RepID=A0A0N4WNL7_HAEPC|nr:unnamed protein product [Haemonchus placei]
MNSTVSLCFVLVCFAAVIEARLFQFGDVLVDPSKDRDPTWIADWEYALERPAKRNRMCLINAGLSQGCDLSDILMAKQQVLLAFGV